MKIILIITFLISFPAQANWVKRSDIQNPQKIWVKKSKCEQSESEVCFNIKGKDPRYYIVGLVDNLDDPTYAKRDIQACTDIESCQLILSGKDCSAYAVGTLRLINEGYTEVYCAEPNGYNQMDGLVEDAALKAIADAEDAQKVIDESDRADRRNQCDADSDGPTMTLPQVTACIKVLLGK